MKIQFKDFVPKDTTPMLALSRRYESTEEVLAKINAWIEDADVKVLNIETILRPASSDDSSGVNVGVEIGGMVMSPWVQIVRVWYS